MTTTSEVLRSLRFGHVAAEKDAALKQTFVPTSDFRSIQSGTYDLVTGVKGAGKSALLIMLLEQGAESSDVLIVPAQNVDDQSYYEDDLPEDRSLLTSDKYFHERWMLHAYSLGALKLLREYGGDNRLKRLKEIALDFGLDPATSSSASTWSRSNLLKVTGTSYSYRGKTTYEQPISSDLIDSETGLAPAILRNALFHALEQVGRELWVVYDRLDDVILFDPERERAMLRGLLAAMVSLGSSSSRFHVKAFMRHDLFDRVTAERPVRNVDQLARLRLRWNALTIMSLVAARAAQSDHALEAFGIPAKRSISELTQSDIAHIWLKLLYARTHDGSTAHPDRHFIKFLRQVNDSSRQFNPRVILSYFNHMARLQADVDDGRPTALPTERPLITDTAAQRARVDLSEERMTQYVFAEFQHVKEATLALVEKPNAFSTYAELLGALGLPDDVDSMKIVREMVARGVLSQGDEGNAYAVAKLYKPFLRSKQAINLLDSTVGPEGRDVPGGNHTIMPSPGVPSPAAVAKMSKFGRPGR